MIFNLFLERGEGREKERERNINVWLPLMHPLLGTWSTTESFVLTGNWTGDPLVRRPALNPLSHTSQDHFKNSCSTPVCHGAPVGNRCFMGNKTYCTSSLVFSLYWRMSQKLRVFYWMPRLSGLREEVQMRPPRESPSFRKMLKILFGGRP